MHIGDKYSKKTRISHLPPDVSVPTAVVSRQFLVSNVSRSRRGEGAATVVVSRQFLVSNVSNDEIQQLECTDDNKVWTGFSVQCVQRRDSTVGVYRRLT